MLWTIAMAIAAQAPYATVVVRVSNAKSCTVNPGAVRDAAEKVRDAA